MQTTLSPDLNADTDILVGIAEKPNYSNLA